MPAMQVLAHEFSMPAQILKMRVFPMYPMYRLFTVLYTVLFTVLYTPMKTQSDPCLREEKILELENFL